MEFKVSIFLFLSLEICLLNPIFCGHECNFPAIFNFGDSNSDTGGLSAAFGQAPSPNGETFFHAPSGRYCDGRLLIDFIAEKLKLPHLSAFLDSIGSNFSHGANFATSGSSIRRQNTTFFESGYSPFSLDVQAVQYSDFVRRSQIARKNGFFDTLLPPKDYFSRALYTFDIGQNDLTSGYRLNLTNEQVEAYIPDVLSQFSDVIKNLYAQGGRYFWIHNTGPVGCLPYIMNAFSIPKSQVDKNGCWDPYNEPAHYFNLRLKEAVLKLRKELPLAAITYVDVYSVKYSLISQAKKLGFGNPFLVCCGSGGKYNYNRFAGCGSKIVINGTETRVKSCEDPSRRVNWDGIHFTEAANKWIFERIADGSFSDPPISLESACIRSPAESTVI